VRSANGFVRVARLFPVGGLIFTAGFMTIWFIMTLIENMNDYPRPVLPEWFHPLRSWLGFGVGAGAAALCMRRDFKQKNADSVL
jgi:hypothetical protein